MNAYLLRPKAPLLFRSGRPFGLRAESLPFPPPSAVAGALRGILFDAREEFKALERLDAVVVEGPLLARRALDGTRTDLFFPKPADAVYFEDKNDAKTLLRRLRPEALEPGSGAGMDLPDGLWPLFLPPATEGKPCGGPDFWRFDAMLAWLHGLNRALPKDEYDKSELPELGIQGPPVDRRAHVAIMPDTLTAEEGALFESDRLDFGPREQAGAWDGNEYGLLARCGETLPEGFFTLGGKGGLTYLEAQPQGWPADCPRPLAQALAGQAGLRLTLATPAYFGAGWRPSWLSLVGDHWQGSPPGCKGLTLRLRAAALERWQPHSGWDLLAYRLARSKGAMPITPLRRLVPAGSVYWFSIETGSAEDAARLWLRSICDDDDGRARRDGFGLALPGVWHDPPR
jgi:CRISPR-associated protein Cmr3